MAHADSDAPSPVRPRRALAAVKPARVANRGFSTLELGGTQVTVKKKSGFGVLVEAHPDALNAVTQAIRSAWDEGMETTKRKRRAATTIQGKDDMDEGRLRWSFAQEAWTIFFREKEGGPMKQTQKGLRPPKENFLTGDTLTPEDFDSASRQYQAKARKLWNELDQTSADRFPDL